MKTDVHPGAIRSLRTKLIFIMLLLILLLMAVVCVFLVRGVQSFYTSAFYKEMSAAFSSEQMAAFIYGAAREPDAPEKLSDIMAAYSGKLGIDADTRNYYILRRADGRVLAGSDSVTELEFTSNILTAMTGSEGAEPGYGDVMDVALPVGDYIIYVKDNRQTVQDLSREVIALILRAVAVGFVISGALSVILARTLLRPIRDMTTAADAMAEGDFSRKIRVESGDEVGTLAATFNEMAQRLETTLEELKNAETLRREFVANVSHELRTPLTSIRSYAETLSDGSDMPPEMQKEFLGVIVNESDRMTKIVQDLLDLSKFDSGAWALKFERFDLEQSVRDVYAAVALDARRRGHIVNLELEWRLPRIVGDRSRIEQVLMNILSNAVKYTPEGGTIEISTGTLESMVWIRVQDSGIGIPEADLPRVFDRFYRVDKARSRASGGTGLGLSIAHEIVERHGGRMDIESKEGVGTTVTVYLPVDGPAEDAAAEAL